MNEVISCIIFDVMNAKWTRVIVAPGYVSLALAFQAIASEYLVDPKGSYVEVAVKATGHDFVAKLEKFKSNISVEKESGRPTAGEFTWDFSDLKTGKEDRDKEMLQWLDHKQNPNGTFTLVKCEEATGGMVLTGDLDIHGTSRRISIPVHLSRQNSGLSFDGDVTMDHRDFGLKKIVKFAFLKVDPVLKVRFRLVGTVQEVGLKARSER